MKKIILKKYTDEYYNFVYEVKKNAYKHYVEEYFGEWNEEKQKEYFEKFINTYYGNSYIIEYNGVNVGFYNDEELSDGSYEIGNICIIPEYQGKGIGTQILKDMLEKYKNKDIKLQYFKKNKVASLYKRLGFMPNGETEFHYQMIRYKTLTDKLTKKLRK